MKKYFLMTIIVLLGMQTFAQKSKPETVVITTNGVCKTCENLFNEKVPYFKGVQDFAYDLKSNKMTITYNPQRTNPDELRKQISNLGYDADNVKANSAAREKLPACCKVKPGEHQHQHQHSGNCKH